MDIHVCDYTAPSFAHVFFLFRLIQIFRNADGREALSDFWSLSGSHNTEGFPFSNRFPLGLKLSLQKQRFRLPTDKSATQLLIRR